jgi:choline-sulfatase
MKRAIKQIKVDRLNLLQQDRITRRNIIKAGIAGTAGLLANHRLSKAIHINSKQQSPNFLFINVDQLSFNAISANGCEYVRTPNIDRLMKRGTSFNYSYSAHPLCCPARASWFTGRACAEHGVFNNGYKIRPEIPDLGQWLSRAGYDCYYAGKWHVPGRDVSRSFNFLHPVGYMGEFGDPFVARTCQAFIHNRNEKKPFFLVAGLMNPHDIGYWDRRFRPGMPPELIYPEIEQVLPLLTAGFNFNPADEPEKLQNRRKILGQRVTNAWSDTQWRYYKWVYYRLVEMVDAAIGGILDALETSRHAENTILIFSADHGDGQAYHKMIEKDFCYEEAVRVPFAISWPGRIPKSKIDNKHLVSGRDFTPTLCDYAAIEPPPDVCGKSIRPLLEGQNIKWRDYVISETRLSEAHMVRSRDFKYITYEGCKTEQFFDLKSDPLETRNLIQDGRFLNEIQKHRSYLKDWQESLKPSPDFKSDKNTLWW